MSSMIKKYFENMVYFLVFNSKDIWLTFKQYGNFAYIWCIFHKISKSFSKFRLDCKSKQKIKNCLMFLFESIIYKYMLFFMQPHKILHYKFLFVHSWIYFLYYSIVGAKFVTYLIIYFFNNKIKSSIFFELCV